MEIDGLQAAFCQLGICIWTTEHKENYLSNYLLSSPEDSIYIGPPLLDAEERN